jgi:hypothetical protein
MIIKISIGLLLLTASYWSSAENSTTPKIAIIIDDLGTNWTQAKKILSLPKEVTASILPFTPHAQKIAIRAQQQGRSIMLHVPMEASEKNELLGPGALRSSMNGWQLIKQLRKNIVSLPSIVGINNHMGSQLTKEKSTMKWVMALLKWQGLYFIDSRTTPESVAEKVANSMGVSTSSRDVFLDNEITEKSINFQFQRAVKIAKKSGYVIIIGHPHDETIAVLRKRIPMLQAAGIKLVSPEMIIQGRHKQTVNTNVISFSSFFE